MAVRGMSSKLYLILFFTLFASVCAREYVPVLLWESSATNSEDVGPRPALTKWPTDDFADYIAKKVNSYKEKPLVVVFSEENLSIEDFSWHDVSEKGSFPEVESLTKLSASVNFFPSVHAPIRAVKDLVNEGFTYKTIDLEVNKDATVSANDGTVLVVKLDDPESVEDRPMFLRRHDKKIGEIYSQLLAKHPNIIAMYTGRFSSFLDTDPEPVHRFRRQASNDSEETKFTEGESKLWRDANNKVFIYFADTYPTLTDTADNTTLELKTYSSVPTIDERDNLQRFIVTFSVGRKITLRFRFPLSPSKYWSLPIIEYEDQSGKTLFLETKSDIEAPDRFSYHCGGTMKFSNGTVTLTLKNIQVQPRLQEARFSDSYDCVWFFTAPIWSGIFVVTLLALIMTWGITMIMDIRTMDRFDDPKGKTITISATE